MNIVDILIVAILAFGVLAVFIVYTFVGSKKTDTIKKQ